VDVLGVELAPAYILGIVVWLTVVVALGWIGLRTRKAVMEGKSELKAFATDMADRYEKRFDTMFQEAKPFLSKVNASLDALPSLDPGKLAVAFEPMFVNLFDKRIGPWASKMGNDLLGQLDSRIEAISNKLTPLASVGAKLMGSHGGEAKAEKMRNRELADNIRAKIPRGLVSLLGKKASTTDDPMEVLDGLRSMASLGKGLGIDVDSIIQNFILGGGEAQPTGSLGMPGIFPGGMKAGSTNETALTDDLSNYGK
jgi:hypothetical protein